jgi:phosphohistidine phosphatase
MMKILYIARHAKSSWDFSSIPDYDRPLLEAGMLRTKKIIKHLKTQEAKPDLIVSSHALRARETARMIADGLSYPAEKIVINEAIYHGDINDIINLISTLTDDKEKVMIVGHNPTLTSLSNIFLSDPIDWLPTSGVVCIEFNTDKWKNIMQAEKKTRFVITNKLIKELKKVKKSSNDKS